VPALHPVAHIAASRIVCRERQDIVAAEFALELREIPHTVANVERGIIKIVLGEGFAELAGNPRCRLRHELHESDRAAVGLRLRLKLALVLDERCDKIGIRMVAGCTHLNIAAVIVGINIAALQPCPAAEKSEYDRGNNHKAQKQPKSSPNITHAQ